MPENAGRTLLSQVEEEKWKARHAELSTSRELAGLFRGWIPERYLASGKPRILYVGKATSGAFNSNDAEREYFNGKGSFWRFARKIAAAVGCPEKGIPCIAWSNISKISSPQIAADASLIAGFEKEAALTLESEIATTKPHVIVFVTLRFGDQVVRQIADGFEDAKWNKSEHESNLQKEEDIWWKRRADGSAVLWMRHPMGASKEKLTFATEKVRALLKLDAS